MINHAGKMIQFALAKPTPTVNLNIHPNAAPLGPTNVWRSFDPGDVVVTLAEGASSSPLPQKYSNPR